MCSAWTPPSTRPPPARCAAATSSGSTGRSGASATRPSSASSTRAGAFRPTSPGAAFLHTAPSVRRTDAGGYVPVSVGTTTSMRMDRFTRGCVEDLGVRAIIGKGGLSAGSLEHLGRHGAVYLSITGGAASYETLQVAEIEDVLWEDLMPECLWKFRVTGFGPLFVTMDSHGASEYERTSERARANMEAAYRKLGL
ncbi:fumarate hydratase C-terminal domain-containing protein [Actinomadura madurae]|uniref:fumarate hydratase C-terminal domain-containing protein n=1 Tax=Actinomadura madurae TaxID=1993 RepID=UPI0020D22174|nr:fumarate hydratase C-terminal domain-containing protein [Actinomadura madurae]MCP9951346.1 fumarate hydratase C-terminal domain-containing protein [Actinomadura madurae]